MFRRSLRIRPLVVQVADAVLSFLQPVPGSLKNHLNGEELLRVAFSSLVVGSMAFGLAEAVMRPVETHFPAPADLGLATTVFVSILDARRRLTHGIEPLTTSARARQ